MQMGVMKPLLSFPSSFPASKCSPHLGRVAGMIEECQGRVDCSPERLILSTIKSLGSQKVKLGNFMGIELNNLGRSHQINQAVRICQKQHHVTLSHSTSTATEQTAVTKYFKQWYMYKEFKATGFTKQP